MKSVKLLLDLAREKAHGNEAELARQIGVPPHHPHEWRTGKRAISAEAAAALCDYLQLPGEEAREWIALAIIENPKNASKAEMLRRALFACWVLGVGSLAMHSNDAEARTDLTRRDSTIEAPLRLGDQHFAHCRDHESCGATRHTGHDNR